MIHLNLNNLLNQASNLSEQATQLPSKLSSFFGLHLAVEPQSLDQRKLSKHKPTNEAGVVEEAHLDSFLRILREEYGVHDCEKGVKQVLYSMTNLLVLEEHMQTEEKSLPFSLLERIRFISVKFLNTLFSFFSPSHFIDLHATYDRYVQKIQLLNDEINHLQDQLQGKTSLLRDLQSKLLSDEDSFAWDRFFERKPSKDELLEKETIKRVDFESNCKTLENEIKTLLEKIGHKHDEFLKNQNRFVVESKTLLSTIQKETMMAKEGKDVFLQSIFLEQINVALLSLQKLGDVEIRARQLNAKYQFEEIVSWLDAGLWSDVGQLVFRHFFDKEDMVLEMIEVIRDAGRYAVKNPSLDMKHLGQNLQLLISMINDESTLTMINKQIKTDFLLNAFFQGYSNRPITSDQSIPPNLHRIGKLIEIAPRIIATFRGMNSGSSILPIGISATHQILNMALGVTERVSTLDLVRSVSHMLTEDESKNLVAFLKTMMIDYASLEDLEKAQDRLRLIGEGLQIANGNITLPSVNFIVEAFNDFQLKMKHAQSNWERLVRIIVQVVFPITMLALTTLGIAALFVGLPIVSIVGLITLIGSCATLGGEVIGLYALVGKMNQLLDTYLFKETLDVIDQVRKEEDEQNKIAMIQTFLIERETELMETFINPCQELFEKMLKLGKFDQLIPSGLQISLEERRIQLGTVKKEEIKKQVLELLYNRLKEQSKEDLASGVSIELSQREIQALVFAEAQVHEAANRTNEAYHSALLRLTPEIRKLVEENEEIVHSAASRILVHSQT